MRQPLAISAGLHLLILLILIVGLPFIHRPDLDTPTPISISMINPSDVARTVHVAPPTKEPPDKDEPDVSQANQAPSTVPPPPPPPPEEEVKPTPTVPPPPPKTPPPAPSIEPLKPIELPKQAVVPQPATLPPLQKIAKVTPPAVKPPPPVVTPPKITKQQEQAFDALLTNLAPNQPQANQQTHAKPVQGHPQQSAIAEQSTQLTADEMAEVRERMKACWVVPAGSSEVIVLNVVADYSPDMRLQGVTFVETNDLNPNDPNVRVWEDSVTRALRSPVCNPLPIPPGKLTKISFRFDPREMFGP
jgi:hypothetical protein